MTASLDPPRAFRVARLAALATVTATLAATACERAAPDAEPAPAAGEANRGGDQDGDEDPVGEASPAHRAGEATGAAPDRPPEVEAALGRAKAAAKQLGGTLKSQLVARLQADGAAEAVDFCAENAQRLTGEVSGSTGVQVGRSALRVRNAENAGPPWVTAALEGWGDRKAAEISPTVAVAEVDGARRVRFAAPIPVEAPCLQCHGPPDLIPESVATRLDAHYPGDAARGYQLGDVRGAVWAEATVE